MSNSRPAGNHGSTRREDASIRDVNFIELGKNPFPENYLIEDFISSGHGELHFIGGSLRRGHFENLAYSRWNSYLRFGHRFGREFL